MYVFDVSSCLREVFIAVKIEIKHVYMNNFFLCNLELERDGFCQNPLFECLVAEVPEEHKSNEGKCSIMAFCFYCSLPCLPHLILSV